MGVFTAPGYRLQVLETERLLLRGWRASDRAPFAAMNADPEVMRYIPSVLTRAESDERLERIVRALEQDGFGLWAVEERSSQRFLGFTGLARPAFDAHFTPAVEVGWRLARDAWGHGFATEAAQAAVASRSTSSASPSSCRSPPWRTRARAPSCGASACGMTPPTTSTIPTLPPGHPLRRHVLYRLSSG